MTTPEEQQETKLFSSFEDDKWLEREHEEAIADFDKKHGWKNISNGNGKNISSTRAQQPRPAKEECIQKYNYGNTLIEAIIVEKTYIETEIGADTQ